MSGVLRFKFRAVQMEPSIPGRRPLPFGTQIQRLRDPYEVGQSSVASAIVLSIEIFVKTNSAFDHKPRSAVAVSRRFKIAYVLKEAPVSSFLPTCKTTPARSAAGSQLSVSAS
jgi:hypothetical protein